MTENIRFYYYCIQWFTELLKAGAWVNTEEAGSETELRTSIELCYTYKYVEGAFRTQDICKFYNNSVWSWARAWWIRDTQVDTKLCVSLRVVPGRSHVRVSYPQTIIRVHNSEEFNLRLRVELHESLQSTLFQTFKYGSSSPINPTTAMNE